MYLEREAGRFPKQEAAEGRTPWESPRAGADAGG